MKTIYYVLAMLMAALFANAQIQQTIGDYSLKWGQGRRAGQRPFVGTFEFENLPEPLKPTKVNFTLEAVGKYLTPEHMEADWTIRLLHLDNCTQILSDTLFYWPGPHHPGDLYTNCTEFIPLQSGHYGMTLYLFGFGQRMGGASESGLTIELCLDGDGRLEYLGKGTKFTEKRFPLRTFFFGPDSVRIIQYAEERDSYAFEYEIIIKPLPKIGDTAMIHYYLIANEDLPDGVEMQICAFSMEYVSKPERMNFPISKGQKLEFLLKAVPRAVRNNHGITLSLIHRSLQDNLPQGQAIQCRFVFNADSTLKYVNNIGFHFDPKSIYPDNLPWANAIYDNIDIVWDSLSNDYKIYQTKKANDY